jgi:hypothetical protein
VCRGHCSFVMGAWCIKEPCWIEVNEQVISLAIDHPVGLETGARTRADAQGRLLSSLYW